MAQEETILVATESFHTDYVTVHKGQTVRVGHPLVKGREDFFEPLTVDHDIEPVKVVGRHAGKSVAK